MYPNAQDENSAELVQVEKFKTAGRAVVDKAPELSRYAPVDDPTWQAKTADGESTLADIKRRQREELAEQLEEGTQKRFKIVNFTSEDSHVVGEKRLYSAYCSICGEHAVAGDVDLFGLPKRKTDSALALDEAMYFHKNYANFGERMLLRRQNGVERQYRFYCRHCRALLGYRSSPPKETSKYSYFFKIALVQEQSHAEAFRK